MRPNEITKPWMAISLALFAMMFLNGCKVVGAIFKTGLGIGVFITVVIVALIGGVAALIRK
jgi:hypothetical protein